MHFAQRHDNVQALTAAGFEECRQAKLLQKRVHKAGRVAHFVPGNTCARVEVKNHTVGVLQRLRARIEGVEFNDVPLRSGRNPLRLRDLD